MKYKLLLLDVDGTLVESSGSARPSKRLVESIGAAKKQLQVSVVTGRADFLAAPVTNDLELSGPSVFDGGASILDLPSYKEVWSQKLSVEKLREVLKIATPFNQNCFIEQDKYKNRLKKPDDIISPSVMFYVDSVDRQVALNLIEELSLVDGIAAHTATSWSRGDVVDMNITHEAATKKSAVHRLIDIFSCEKEEVIAIGDYYNDLPLFEAAGFSVAMGNAPEEIKKIVDYVAPPLSQDGVADAISRFILGK